MSLAELADEAWFLTPDDGAGWPGVFYQACTAAGFDPVAVHEFLGDQIQLQRMIADGLGVSVVQPTLRPIPDVVIRPLAGTPLWCRYVLAWRCDSVGENEQEALFHSAIASYRELVGRSPHLKAWAARAWSVTEA